MAVRISLDLDVCSEQHDTKHEIDTKLKIL
jgi:hypothetical protein